jgi:hypothetical protein
MGDMKEGNGDKRDRKVNHEVYRKSGKFSISMECVPPQLTFLQVASPQFPVRKVNQKGFSQLEK